MGVFMGSWAGRDAGLYRSADTRYFIVYAARSDSADFENNEEISPTHFSDRYVHAKPTASPVAAGLRAGRMSFFTKSGRYYSLSSSSN